MASRESLPISICVLGSLALHATLILPMIGTALGSGTMLPGDLPPEDESAQAPEEKPPPPPSPPPDIPLPPEFHRPREAERITLGIDDGSDQPLVTWIGYDEYEKHMARLSEVEQAAMRMTPEGGGEPASAPPGAMSAAAAESSAAPPESAPAAVAHVERAADQGQPPSLQPKAEATPTPPNAPPPAEPPVVTESKPPTARAPEPPPIVVKVEQPTPPAPPEPAPAPGLAVPRATEVPRAPDGAPLPPEPPKDEPPKLDPIVRPAESAGKSEEPPKDDPKGEDPPPRPESPPAPAPEPSTEIAPRTSESKPPAPEAQPFPTPVPDPEENSPAHDQPDRNAPPSPPLAPGAQPQPQPDAAPGAPTKPAAAPGPPVSGELTEQEADPTSTVDVPAELWRNGKPLAAKGLRILTRRPQMLPEYLAIQTSAGRNPVFELNFDNQGLVRNVVVLEGSGAPELDDRLVDCLYKWRARGERLSTVKAGDRLKFTMRMLVR